VDRRVGGRGRPLTGAALRSLAAGIVFVCTPIALIGAAISARTAGYVDARETVEARVLRYLAPARIAAATEGVPLPLVLAVASVESAGRANAVSPAGAVGLMQLLPSTAEDVAGWRREAVGSLTDPARSLQLGARYLAAQLRSFAAYPCGRDLALCAYNAGPGAVGRWLREGPPPPDEDIGMWIPPRYTETRAYVRRVRDFEERWREILAAPISSPATPPAPAPR
jgi:soluble lytic murein transglycosylase